jgi:hypothetical protein
MQVLGVDMADQGSEAVFQVVYDELVTEWRAAALLPILDADHH